jgi:outer membrane protein, heavy metal efflux system
MKMFMVRKIRFLLMLMALPGCMAPKHNPELVANSTFEKFPSIVARQKLPTKDIEKETSNSKNDLDKASDIQLVKMESQLPLPTLDGSILKKDGNPITAPKNLPDIEGAPSSKGGPLSLQEVLDAVEQNYPLLRAIEQERTLAGGRLLSSLGAFDLNLTASGTSQDPATYNNYRSNVGMNQLLPFGGIGTFAGYRTGFGEFPTYYLDQKTADGGEFRAGLNIPLLRDKSIDRVRASLQQAKIDTQIAEPLIERQRLDFQRAAARTYWNWVGAGQRLKISERLVRLAVERDAQLKAKVEAGPTANIERVDNQQNIAFRNGLLVQAQRAFQQATIDLSLFLRDATGTPTLAGLERLPLFPGDIKQVESDRFDAFVQKALDQRPEPQRLRLQRERVTVDLRLAENQNLASVNATIAGAQDIGYGKSPLSGPNGLDRSSLNAGLALQLPLQQREAKGKIVVAKAQLAQLNQQLRHTEDLVRAEVQDSYSALERAHEFYQQTKKRVELAKVVASAEREQLLLGRSDVLRVTLREQAAFEAEILEISAQQDFFRAQAEFRISLGLSALDEIVLESK